MDGYTLTLVIIGVATVSYWFVRLVGDLVSGSNKATVYSGYKVITEPHFVLCGTSEDDFLNALYAGDIPQVSKVTRDVWKLEPEKEDASDVDI